VKRVILLLLLLSITSCSTKKEILYFQDAEDYNNIEFINQQYTIQPNDILKIDIQTPDYESADDAYNIKSNAVAGVNLDALRLEGYLVGPDYLIKHNILGEIFVKDKTTSDLEKEIKDILNEQDQLKAPTVNVRIINAKFTVQGEVQRPGTYNMIEGRITLLQALGFAGDLTINGVRNNILIIRQQNGKQIIGRVDLTSASIVNSPFYFVKQNDYIYVEQNGPRTKSAGYLNNFGSVLGTVSILLSTYLILRSNF